MKTSRKPSVAKRTWFLHGARFFHSCGAIGCFSSHAAIRLWWRLRNSGTWVGERQVDGPCIQQCPRRRHGFKIQQLGVRGRTDARRVVETPSVLHDAGTPRQPYCAACVAELLRCLSLRPLDLSDNSIEDLGAKSLAESLGNHSGLKVNLEGNFIRRRGAGILSDAVKSAPGDYDFDLRNNRRDCPERVATSDCPGNLHKDHASRRSTPIALSAMMAAKAEVSRTPRAIDSAYRWSGRLISVIVSSPW